MLIISKIFQNNHKNKPKASRNRSVLKKLKKLGFSMPNNIRALIELNNIKYKNLTAGGISKATITTTIDGLYKKKNKTAMKNIAGALKLCPAELFQDQDAL